MNSPALPIEPVKRSPELVEAGLSAAFRCITPVWPLDRYIAVNPWWNLSHEPLSECAAKLAFWKGTQALMPREYYAELWDQGRIHEFHLKRAAQELQVQADVPALCDHLKQKRSWQSNRLVTDELDRMRDLTHSVSWHDEVVNRISRFCAGYFDQHQAQWSSGEGMAMYAAWQKAAAQDRGVEMLMGVKGLRAEFAKLPNQDWELIEEALETLPLPEEAWPNYASALLLSVSGWASYCAYLQWEANPDATNLPNGMRQLLAIRLAWDLVLWRHANSGNRDLDSGMQLSMASGSKQIDWNHRQFEWDWVWQRALEYSYQDEWVRAIETEGSAAAPNTVQVDAVFCIDVRSEPFRRSLEQISADKVQTRGFAGFFGVPIAYQSAGTEHAVPHVPGLLSPKFIVSERDVSGRWGVTRREQAWGAQRWSNFSHSGVGIFGFVEALGMQYGWKLLKDGLLEKRKSRSSDVTEIDPVFRGPEGEVPLETRVELVHSVLLGMAMTTEFAPLVLLVGHGSSSENNPHAASLDCGACCGQRGEVNARLLAAMLNDEQIRKGLGDRGVRIPESTQFLAALHDTTLDRVELFTRDLETPLDRALLSELEQWLDGAGAKVRRERAARLGVHAESDAELAKQLERYALNWSQVRPEWGLAGNAALVVAPRSRTRGLNLQGRCFLHEYRAWEDTDASVLEQIMTAPMVVAHWINMQYYASTVDPLHYGAGNKVIHNVVGGTIGVFEGNSGDLRIGLPKQSVHDGSKWVHEPQRLNVLIEAPGDWIERIVHKHEKVRELVDGQWLYLFRIDAGSGKVLRYREGSWTTHLESTL